MHQLVNKLNFDLTNGLITNSRSRTDEWMVAVSTQGILYIVNIAFVIKDPVTMMEENVLEKHKWDARAALMDRLNNIECIGVRALMAR